MIAAEKTGRVSRLIELDAGYCDTTILRWQKLTGKAAKLAATGESYEDVGAARVSAPRGGIRD